LSIGHLLYDALRNGFENSFDKKLRTINKIILEEKCVWIRENKNANPFPPCLTQFLQIL
jgi:hypothetical protein